MSRSGQLNDVSRILIATAVGGGAGYALVVWSGIRLGSDYADFNVFWAALHLVVGALAGVQYEISRSTRPREAESARPARSAVRGFMIGTAVIAALLVLATSPLWIATLDGSGGVAVLVPLVIGVTGYVTVAVLAGVFYGLGLWTLIARMIMFDGLMRLVFVGALLLLSTDTVVLAWGTVMPFVVTSVVFWLLSRRRVAGEFFLDVGYRRLSWNVVRTVAAAAASGVLVSGLPLFIGVAAAGESEAYKSTVLFVISATRAPIVIVVLSLQSYLIVRFRAVQDRLIRLLLSLSATILVGSALLAALALVLGPWALELIRGDGSVPGYFIAIIVFSGGLTGVLYVTGAAALSRSWHFVSTLGWFLAAIVVVAALALPLPIEGAITVAIILGPVVGVAAHGIGLAVTRGPRV